MSNIGQDYRAEAVNILGTDARLSLDATLIASQDPHASPSPNGQRGMIIMSSNIGAHLHHGYHVPCASGQSFPLIQN